MRSINGNSLDVGSDSGFVGGGVEGEGDRASDGWVRGVLGEGNAFIDVYLVSEAKAGKS